MKHTLVAVVCSLGATAASAHEIDWKPYAGAAIAQNEFEDWSMGIPDDGSFTGGSIDDESTGFVLVAGVQPYEHFGLELAVHDFGETGFVANSDGSGTTWEAGPVTQTFEMRSIDVNLVGRLPITQQWNVFGRVGISYYAAEWRFSGTMQPATPVSGQVGEQTHQEPVFGAGVQYRFDHWGLVATWQARDFFQPNTDEASKATSISLAAAYHW